MSVVAQRLGRDDVRQIPGKEHVLSYIATRTSIDIFMLLSIISYMYHVSYYCLNVLHHVSCYDTVEYGRPEYSLGTTVYDI